MEMTLICIFLGIIALAEWVCCYFNFKAAKRVDVINNLQKSLNNQAEQLIIVNRQLQDERETYKQNRTLMLSEIAALKLELEKAKKAGYVIETPGMNDTIEVSL